MKILRYWTVCLALFGLVASASAGPRQPAQLRADDHLGLTWVSDPLYLVESGLGSSAVVPPSEAARLIAELNAGRVDNFGYLDWRVPTLGELVRLSRIENQSGELAEVSRYLATQMSRRPGRPGASPVRNRVSRGTIDAQDLVFAWPVRGQVVEDDISSVVIFGTNSVYLKQGATVASGDVVANDASEGPTLACSGREVCVGVSVDAAPDTDIKGDSIQIKNNADVQGAVFCNELDNNGSNPGLTCGPVSLPVFEVLPPFIEQSPRPDAEDVTVLIGESIVLPAGDYGILKVKKNGLVRFTGGIYNFAEIDSGTSTDLLFDAASEIRVEGKFSLDQNSTLGSDQGVAASQIVFYVAGINGNNGNFGATPRAAKIGVGATASANFYVPNGTLWLRQNSVTTGAFLARDTILGDGATTNLDSAFGNQPPTADPQTVSTGGAGMLTITLTGSDPENLDLAFSIEVDPLNGVLTDLTPIVPDPVEERDEEGNPTGEFIQPPIVSATVKYTPNDPQAEEEDSFVFKVTDVAGAMGTAAVTINPPPEGEDDPPPPQAVIEALDAELQIPSNASQSIPLGFAAPEGVSVTVSIISLPSNGSLADSGGAAIESVPYALPDNVVTYTSALDFVGSDSFDFEAAGEIEGLPASDQATVTIDVAAQFSLAEDSQVTTDRNTPVTVTLQGNQGGAGDSPGGPLSISSRRKLIFRATALDGAVVAANVSDADGDGLGDGKDPLPGPAPVLISAGVDVNLGSGGPVEGVARIHMEFDVRALPQLATDIQSATVTLTTEKGSVDSLNTNFFVGCTDFENGCPGEDGILSESDFETPLGQLFGVVMPVPAEAEVGEEGTFQFDVTGFVSSLADDFISIQGRVNENLAGGGFQRGLQIHSNADGNLALGKEPKLEVITPAGIPLTLVFTLLSLPANGTLTDPSSGAPVQVGDKFVGTTQLLYTPDLNFAGSDSFSYQVAEGIVTGTANVDITINPTDNCEQNGRPVGCAPGQ